MVRTHCEIIKQSDILLGENHLKHQRCAFQDKTTGDSRHAPVPFCKTPATLKHSIRQHQELKWQVSFQATGLDSEIQSMLQAPQLKSCPGPSVLSLFVSCVGFLHFPPTIQKHTRLGWLATQSLSTILFSFSCIPLCSPLKPEVLHLTTQDQWNTCGQDQDDSAHSSNKSSVKSLIQIYSSLNLYIYQWPFMNCQIVASYSHHLSHLMCFLSWC